MTPILYEKDEIDFTSQGLGSLVEIYDVDVAEQRNGLLQLTASYPVTGVRYDDISVGRIILAKPNQRDEPHAFRITSTDLDIMGHNVMIEADSITYDLNHNIVKHLNVSGADGQTMMSALKNAIVNPSIFTFYSDITHVSSTSLDYVNPMEAVMGVKGSFLQIWGGELKRENRRVAMFNRRGRDNVATFRLGKNISGLKYKVDISSLVTRILPIKSVQENDTTTYLEGTPVSSQYINSYEQIYTIKVDFTDDTIKTVDDLNKASANWFVDSANTARDKPSVTIDIDVLSLQDSADYQDKFKDLESVGLTDTVTVYVPEYGINVTAIVNELHFDPIQERVTKLTVGTARMSFADSSRVQLSDLQDKVISVQEQADQIAVSANGKNTNYYGSIAPSHPQAGDLWYWVNGDFSGIKQFVNGDWADVVDTNTQQQITDGVNQAVQDAQKYSDKLVADNAEQVNRTLSDVQAKQADLSSQQAGLDTKAQGYANKALADAKANTLVTATQTAKDASDALAKAKTDLTTSLNKEVTDRVNAVTALDTKAKGYADTAKADAINAATTADGVINKKIDDTASSITSTISQNKTDADGKITTAQNTATQALNGLATKVSQTVFDTKTGQLQTDLNTTTATANTSKQDIVAIKSDNTKQDARMTTIESDANGTKTTVSNLQTDLGKANGSITTLQQRADGFDATVTKVNTLLNDLSQVNMVVNSEFSPDLAGWYIRGTQTLLSDGPNSSDVGFNKSGHVVLDTTNGTGTGNVNYTSMAYPVTPSSIISVSVELKASVSGTNPQIGFIYYDANMNAVAGQRGGVPVTTDYKLWKYMGTAIPATAKYVSFDILISNVYKAKYVMSQPMMVIGSTVGAYVQGQYNNNGATAKAQLTADNATLSINNYKTDADGRISKAQADIIVNANAITQKVSQSDYNAKTGDLTTKVNTAQSTADSATSTIGAYKTSNDARVASAESKITANATAITSKVSQSDYNTKTGQIDGQISTINQTAGKISQTVSDVKAQVDGLSVGGRNLFVLATASKGWLDLSYNVTAPGDTSLASDFIPVTANTTYVAQQWYIMSHPRGGGYLRYAFYDSTKTPISRVPAPASNSATYSKWVITTPANASFIRMSFDYTANNGSNVKFEQGNMPTDWTPAPEDTDNKISTVSQTVDSISSIVSDPTTGLTKRVQTAEGSISTVQSDVSDLQSKQTQTASGLTTEISNRQTSDTNTLTQAKDFTTSSITNYDKGMQSQLTQTSDSILGKVGAVNLFPNSEFEKDYGYRSKNPGVTLSLTNKDLIDGKYNGTVTVKATNAGWQGYWARNIEVQGGQKYSGSVLVHYTNGGVAGGYATLDTWFVDKDGNRINGSVGGTRKGTVGEVTSPYWIQLYFEGVTAPDNAVNLQVSLLTNDKGVGQTAIFTQPMVTATEKLQPYTPNNDITTQLALLKDNWSIGIADNAGAITNGIVGNSTNMSLISNNVVINAPSTQIKGTAWINSAMIGNGAIGTAQIGDASITSAKIMNLDVNKITGNVSSFIQSNWNGIYSSVAIDGSGMKITTGGTVTTLDQWGTHWSRGNLSSLYGFGYWRDSSGNNTTSTGLYMGVTGSENAFINILGTNGAAALVLAGSAMDYGANLNVMQGTLNSYVNVNIRTQLHFKGNKYNSPSYIEINESNRTFNFFTGGESVGGGNYFYFNQNVISAGTFSSTSVLSKKNVKSVYDEDALGEIAKTQLVNFEYKNRIGQNHVSPIIDDVNSEKEYYIPKTILGQDNEYVDMYSMISMAWKAIQQLNEKIGEK